MALINLQASFDATQNQIFNGRRQIRIAHNKQRHEAKEEVKRVIEINYLELFGFPNK